ncbi:hypothetical protein BDZ89DRAFT_190137 [Hymenopellis radicata]|nr:hypothetical protein BDZ89DRAFT_190137 [Hymenopellis radicata]
MQRHLVGVSFLFDPPHFRDSSYYCSSRYPFTRLMPSDNSSLENLAMSRRQERLHQYGIGSLCSPRYVTSRCSNGSCADAIRIRTTMVLGCCTRQLAS